MVQGTHEALLISQHALEVLAATLNHVLKPVSNPMRNLIHEHLYALDLFSPLLQSTHILLDPLLKTP